MKELKILYILDHTIWFKFRCNVQIRIKYCLLRDFRLSVSAFATVARKSVNGNFTAKIAFPIGHFMLPLLTLTLEA